MYLREYFASLKSETGATNFLIVHDRVPASSSSSSSPKPRSPSITKKTHLRVIKEHDVTMFKFSSYKDDTRPCYPSRKSSEGSLSSLSESTSSKQEISELGSLLRPVQQHRSVSMTRPSTSRRLTTISKRSGKYSSQRHRSMEKEARRAPPSRAFERSYAMPPPKPPVRKESSDALCHGREGHSLQQKFPLGANSRQSSGSPNEKFSFGRAATRDNGVNFDLSRPETVARIESRWGCD